MSDEPTPAPRGIPPDAEASMLKSSSRGYRFGEQLDLLPAQAFTAEPAEPNPLEAYFDAHKEGPGLRKWRHYFEAYHRHFSRFVGRDITLVEIGVFSGGSLGMWQAYFGPRCRIVGIDIMDSCRKFEGGQVKILIGDQSDRAFLDHVKAVAPVVDIVIDDGSHHHEHQIASFEALFPHLRSGGVYLCEDIHREFNPFHDYINGLTHHFNALGTPRPGFPDSHDGLPTNAIQREAMSFHQYPYLTFIEKRHQPITKFHAPRRGSEWIHSADWLKRSTFP